MPDKTYQLGLVQGDAPHRVNGRVRGRVMLVCGADQHLDNICLDSESSRLKFAKACIKRFPAANIDPDEVNKELMTLCASALALVVENEQKRKVQAKNARRLSTLADKFIVDLEPQYHRDATRIFFRKPGREVAIGSVWPLAGDAIIDAVAETKEAIESDRTDHPGCLSLWKDAIVRAATRAIPNLPEHEDTDADPTIRPEELLTGLVQFLMKVRTFRLDSANPVTTSYWSWACGLAPGECWQQCFSDPLWARTESGSGHPRIAVVGAVLTGELKWKSNRRLGADLRAAGFGSTDEQIKVSGTKYRVWYLTTKVFDAIGEGVPE